MGGGIYTTRFRATQLANLIGQYHYAEAEPGGIL